MDVEGGKLVEEWKGEKEVVDAGGGVKVGVDGMEVKG